MVLPKRGILFRQLYAKKSLPKKPFLCRFYAELLYYLDGFYLAPSVLL